MKPFEHQEAEIDQMAKQMPKPPEFAYSPLQWLVGPGLWPMLPLLRIDEQEGAKIYVHVHIATQEKICVSENPFQCWSHEPDDTYFPMDYATALHRVLEGADVKGVKVGTQLTPELLKHLQEVNAKKGIRTVFYKVGEGVIIPE